VVDHVRNALVKLVAEIRAATPAGQELPSEAAADQAMNFVITGKRARLNVTASQASGPVGECDGLRRARAGAGPGLLDHLAADRGRGCRHRRDRLGRL
jgi:hypothetical protein